MSYKDLRGWIDEVDKLGELKRFEGADWNLEIGAITEIVCRENKARPALLFDNIKGYPQGFRVLSGMLNTMPRLALTVGTRKEISGLQFVQKWRNRMRNLKPIPPALVNKGPVMGR